MSKRSLPEQQRRDALDAMRKSAAESEDGVPCWGAIARQPGMPSRPTLKRWWQEEQDGRASARASNVVQFPPPVGAVGASSDVTAWSAVEYWVWRWGQVQAKIDRFESDVALVNGWKYQDEVWRQMRAALDAERKKTGLSAGEVRQKIREAAAVLPAEHVEIFVEEFRRRKLVA